MKNYIEVLFNGDRAALTGKTETTCWIDKTKIIRYQLIDLFTREYYWAEAHEFITTGGYLYINLCEDVNIKPEIPVQKSWTTGLRVSW